MYACVPKSLTDVVRVCCTINSRPKMVVLGLCGMWRVPLRGVRHFVFHPLASKELRAEYSSNPTAKTLAFRFVVSY